MGGSPVRRYTLAEREREIRQHPETDTRARYPDGTPAYSGDWVVRTDQPDDGPWRVSWWERELADELTAKRTGDRHVQPATYHGALDGGGTVAMTLLRLHRRA